MTFHERYSSISNSLLVCFLNGVLLLSGLGQGGNYCAHTLRFGDRAWGCTLDPQDWKSISCWRNVGERIAHSAVACYFWASVDACDPIGQYVGCSNEMRASE
jgi:hypothetical protein